MGLLRTLLVCIALYLTSCAALAPGTKVSPQFQGVDQRAQSLVDEFKAIASLHHITFKNTVTIGFKKIGQGNIVGICTYGSGWREIQLDTDFWDNTDAMERMALIYHELGHCYCGRAHDWAAGKEYPETEEGRIKEAEEWQKNGGPLPGRFTDGCPTSLMYPVVVSTECVLDHYSSYADELMDRCIPF